MPKSVDIVYFIEHTARELDVACAVKYMLAAHHGIQMEICSIVTGLEENLARWQPEVVAIPYATSVKDTNLEDIVSHWSAARYINLSFEQVLGKTQKSFKAPKDQFARQHLVYSAWGDFFVKYLRGYDVPDEHLVVIGNPALALYTLPYRNYYGQVRAELAHIFGLSLERRWVFVPENYGWAFFQDNNVRDRIRRGFDPDDAFRYRDFALDSLRQAAVWWREAAKMDGVEIIVRPRPAIPTESFRSAVLEFAGEIPDHLHIIKYGTVREWTLASDLIFSSYSTTLLDAALAEKPVYMMTPYPVPDFLFAEWYDLTAKITSFEEFRGAIQANPMDINWPRLQEWVKQQMMSRGDAVANLSDLVATVVQNEHSIAAPVEIAEALQKPSFDRTWRKLRRFGWNIWLSVLAFWGNTVAEKDWNPHEDDLIDPDGIAKRVARWGSVLGN